MTDRFLAGRVALLTGGATGICRATALAMADAGADIVIGSLTEEVRAPAVAREGHTIVTNQDLENTRQDILRCGARAISRPLNVAIDASCDAIVDAAMKDFGKSRRSGEWRGFQPVDVDGRSRRRGVAPPHRRQPHRLLSDDQARVAGDDGTTLGQNHQYRVDRREHRRKNARRLLCLEIGNTRA